MASRLQDVILRGTSGARPAATDVAPGTLYYSTDTETTDRSDGTNWETFADAGAPPPASDTGAAQRYYLDETASDIATYKTLSPIPTGGVEDDDSQSVVVGDGEVLIEAYAVGDAFGTALIPAGDWTFNIYRYVSSAANSSEIVIRVYRYATDTTETELFNTTTGEINDTTVTLQTFHSAQSSFVVDPTDRLLIKFFAKTTSAVAKVIHYTHNGASHYTNFTTPFISVITKHVISLVIDGGGSVITTGVKGFVSVPFACVIQSWRLLSIDASATAGDIVIDIWKDTYANYPPDDSDSITGGAEPEIPATNNKAESSSLAGWNINIAEGDILGFNVDSCNTITKAILQLEVEE